MCSSFHYSSLSNTLVHVVFRSRLCATRYMRSPMETSEAPIMRPYGRQILICENGDCADSETATRLQQRFAELARAHGLNKLRNPERVKCTLTGCLGVCAGGPILV